MALTQSHSLTSSDSSSIPDDYSLPETPGLTSSIFSSKDRAHVGEQFREEIVAEARTAVVDERKRKQQQAMDDDQHSPDQGSWNKRPPLDGLRRDRSDITSLGPKQAWALGLLTLYLLVWCIVASNPGAAEGHSAACPRTVLVIAFKLLCEVAKKDIPMIGRLLVASWPGFCSLRARVWHGMFTSDPLLYWLGSCYLTVMAAAAWLAAIIMGIKLFMLGQFSVAAAAADEAQADDETWQAHEKQ